MIRSPIKPLTLALALGAVGPGVAGPPAFPGAVGQGAASVGGRGGEVYVVDTLEDYAPHKREKKIKGSFRHALRAEMGPRTIVFNVSGVIRLREQIEVQKDRVTIAGQTSPGGITLYGYPLEVSGAKDVVIRHLRVRCGDANTRGAREARGTGRGDLDASRANAVHVGNGAERVIVDHVSASWGIDENFSVTLARDVTVQNCLIAEALNDSFHPKGTHGYGTLIRGELTAEDQAAARGGYTFAGNLWAHHRARNPSIAGEQHVDDGEPESARRRTDVNLVGNVVYDWGDEPTHRSQRGDVRLNLVGNYYVNGPASDGGYLFRGGGGPDALTLIYQRRNRHDRDQDARHNGVLIDSPEQIARAFHDLDPNERVVDRHAPYPFYAGPDPDEADAEAAYQRVVRRAGASLWRDAVDARVVRSLQDRTGGLIDSQEEFRTADGGLPGVDDLPERRRPEGYDRDEDGMPDAFETAHGLDPLDPADGNQQTLSDRGYTNLEVYLDRAAHPERTEATQPSQDDAA